MKKLFLVMAVALVATTASAAMNSNDWKFEPTLGPSLNIKNSANRFGMNFKMGKEIFGFQLGMAFAGTPKVMVKPAFVFEYPFYFTFSKKNDFSVGPTANIGPVFGFSGATMVDFISLGIGCRTAYQITNSFGVVAELFNMDMGFVQWVKGAGVNGNTWIAYNMKFGVFMLF
jgi:hypothetical protein